MDRCAFSVTSFLFGAGRRLRNLNRLNHWHAVVMAINKTETCSSAAQNNDLDYPTA